MKYTVKKQLIRAALVAAIVATTVASPAATPASAGTGKRPNIVIILGDDLGFSDMGCFGGETAGYMATVNDSAPTDLRMDGFRISFTYGWHKIVEGQKRLKSGE